MTTDNRPRILLTVDVAVVFQRRWILLITRGKEPAGKLALPGGHFEAADTSLKDRGIIEVAEEAHLFLDNTPDWEWQWLMPLDGINRDSRDTPNQRDGQHISMVGLVEIDQPPDTYRQEIRGGDDATKADIYDLLKLQADDFAFDHHLVIQTLRQRYQLAT